MQTLLNPWRNEYGGRDDMPDMIHCIAQDDILGSYWRQDPMISLCYMARLLTLGGI